MGTFSARIKAAYSIGLLTKDQFLDLERLRKIRNEFAHTWRLIDITKPKIVSLIDAMSYSRIDDLFPETPADKVRSSMSCLLLELRSAAHQVSKKGTQARLIGNHLMRGFSGDFDAQLQSAREELKDILLRLQGSQGKKREFYIALLTRFMDRLTVLARPETPEQRKWVTALHADVRHALPKSPA